MGMNMGDLISRAEVVGHFQRLEEASNTNGQYNEGFVDGLDYCISFISMLPSAYPKRGKWIDMGDFEQCSVCTATHLKTIQTMYGKAAWIKSYYCPACGADMREPE